MNHRDGIGVYVDLENIQRAVQTLAPTTKPTFVVDPIVNLQLPLTLAGRFGHPLVVRAYGNWARLAKYQRPLRTLPYELVQVFPCTAGSKNGADIRLVMDAMQDLRELPELRHIIVMTGDTDFVPLAHFARRLGREVTGIGTRANAGHAWVAACDHFVWYEDQVDIETGPTDAPLTPPSVERQSASKTEAAPGGEILSPLRKALKAIRMQLPTDAAATTDLLRSAFELRGRTFQSKADARQALLVPVDAATEPDCNKVLQVLHRLGVYTCDETGVHFVDAGEPYLQLTIRSLERLLAETTGGPFDISELFTRVHSLVAA